MELTSILLSFFVLAVLVAAAVVTMITGAIALAMLMVSVLAISVMVGFSSGKVLAGVRALFAQLGVLAGALVGSVAALVLTHVWWDVIHHGMILLMGGAAGAFGGLLVALLAHGAVQMAVERLPKLRLPRTSLFPSSQPIGI